MTDLGEWDENQEGPGTSNADSDDQQALLYPNVAVFVANFLAPMYARSSTAWCPQSWKHAEGSYRFEALWRAWEHLRLDPTTGSSVWLSDHADPHLAVLLSSDGPFKGCTPDSGHHGRAKPLPIELPPTGLFE